MTAAWRPAWGERDLAAGVVQEMASPLIDDLEAHEEWAREAARFSLVLGIILDARGAPLRREREEHAEAAKGRGAGAAPPPWSVRHLWLDETRRPSGARGGGSGAVVAHGDRLPDQVAVSGHLKRQPCGPGGKDREWIYVESYEARRWVSPREELLARLDAARPSWLTRVAFFCELIDEGLRRRVERAERQRSGAE